MYEWAMTQGSNERPYQERVAALVKERLTVLVLTIESHVSHVILAVRLRNELKKTEIA